MTAPPRLAIAAAMSLREITFGSFTAESAAEFTPPGGEFSAPKFRTSGVTFWCSRFQRARSLRTVFSSHPSRSAIW